LESIGSHVIYEGFVLPRALPQKPLESIGSHVIYEGFVLPRALSE